MIASVSAGGQVKHQSVCRGAEETGEEEYLLSRHEGQGITAGMVIPAIREFPSFRLFTCKEKA